MKILFLWWVVSTGAKIVDAQEEVPLITGIVETITPKLRKDIIVIKCDETKKKIKEKK